jgi:hypothetical protein
MLVLKYLRLPFFFDAGLLQQETAALDAFPWQAHYQVTHYEGEWTAIPLRSKAGEIDDIFITPGDDCNYQDTVFLNNSPYLKEVLQHFKCPLQSVRLLKLNAGSIIKEHRDAELNFENGEIRLHIPVLTHADVEFFLDRERLQLLAGECWYLNFNLPHAISNNSPVNRVHLVIDAVVNDWVKETFSAPDIVIKKETEDLSKEPDTEAKKQMIVQFREMNTSLTNKMADELEKELSGLP